MPSWRVCVALMVPSPWREEINGLRRALGANLERIEPHLTLIPPVNINTEDLGEALAVLRWASYMTDPFELQLGPVTNFLPETPVVMLSVGGEGAPSLTQFRNTIMKPPLEREVSRPFVPHVTLTHGLEDEHTRLVTRALEPYSADVVFDRIYLLREIDGRRWEPVADIPFEAPTIVGRGGYEMELTFSKLIDPEVARLIENDVPETDLVVVARRSQQPLGLLAGKIEGHELLLRRVVVVPEARGEGVGGHVVRALLSEAAKKGAMRAVLDGAQNIPGMEGHLCGDRQKFFERVGFKEGQRLL